MKTCDRCDRKITTQQMIRIQHLRKLRTGNVFKKVYFWHVMDDMHFHKGCWKKEIL